MSGVKHRTVCVELWNTGSHFDVKKDTAISVHRGACDKRFVFDRLWLMMARFGGHWEGQWPLVSGQAYRGQQSWHEFTHSGGEPFVYWFLMCSGHIVKLRSFHFLTIVKLIFDPVTELTWNVVAFRLYKMNYVSLNFVNDKRHFEDGVVHFSKQLQKINTKITAFICSNNNCKAVKL